MSKNQSGSPQDPKSQGSSEKEKTLIIPHELPESATEALESDPSLPEAATESVGAPGAGGEGEEVFVILPEEDGEGGQLPVVETVVVDDQPWDAGPTTTEVLKDVPEDLTAAETTTTHALEEVPLLKANPLSEGETENLPSGDADLGGVESPGGVLNAAKKAEEEIKVIDEIADIAADLEHDEPLEESGALGADPERTTGLVAPAAAPAGSRRLRWVALATSLAALVLVGVFFYPDLERLYGRYLGEGGGGPSTGGQVQALTPPVSGAGSGQEAPGAAKRGAEREELRARIHLALRVGLRADGGKE